MIRVALRSPRRLFRDALAGCLEARSEYTIVGSVADLDDLPMLCELQRPDVVLVDVGAGIGTDPQVLNRLKDCVDRARLVVVYERLASAELGTTVAVLRGEAGPTRERVAAALLAGGISVATDMDASRQGAEGETSESIFIVLVDPAPGDWPTGWDSGLPVALVCTSPPPRA